jgi:hypothetical protein
MPDLIGPDMDTGINLAENYRRMTSTNSSGVGEYYSNFGTRQLAWFKIALANVADGELTPDSLFAAATRGLQLNTEVYFISYPADGAPDYFVVAVAYDTTGDNSKEDDMDQTPTQRELLKAIVDRATGGNSAVTDYTF